MSAPKPAAKPVARKPAATTTAAKPGAKEKATREAKGGSKTDSVSLKLSSADSALIKAVRALLKKKGRAVSKSELMRAGLQLLAARKPGEISRLLDNLSGTGKGKEKSKKKAKNKKK